MLIVDDEEAVVFAMLRYFTARGFHVDCARGLEEALALVAQVRYAILVTDLCLTDVNGAEGLEIARLARECWSHTRTILLTAWVSPELEAQARTHGVDRILGKPLPLPDLERVILALLG
jgi:DNA-binding response OmpR family regulator